MAKFIKGKRLVLAASQTLELCYTAQDLQLSSILGLVVKSSLRNS